MICKYFMCALLLCCIGVTAKAQDKTSGVIYFKQTTYLKSSSGGQIQINGSSMNMPDKVSNEYELIYNANGAKYQKSYAETPPAGSSGGMVFSFAGTERKVFYNFAENKVSEYFPLDGDNYLMNSKLGSSSDTVQKTDETKSIIGFNCKKAIIKYKNMLTEIWYTTDLKFNASPAVPYWTEGVVLAIKNPRVEYQATSAEYYKVKDNEFKIPKDAKPITAEEYKAKQEALLKKMQEGGRVIKFNN